MDHHVKHGISKRKHDPKHKNIKKAWRYFSVDEPGEVEENNLVSGTQLCSSQKKFYHGDVIKKLLEMAPQAVRVVDLKARKYMPSELSEGIGISQQTLKTNVLSSEKLCPKSKDKTFTETLQEKHKLVINGDGNDPDKDKINNCSVQNSAKSSVVSEITLSNVKRKSRDANGIRTADVCCKPKESLQKSTCAEQDRDSSHILIDSSQETEDVSKRGFHGNYLKLKKSVMKSKTSDKTGHSRKKNKKQTSSASASSENQSEMNKLSQERNVNVIENLDTYLSSSSVDKVKNPSNYSKTSIKKRISLNAQNFSTLQKNDKTSVLIKNKKLKIKSTGESMSHTRLETDNHCKNKKKIYTKQESDSYKESASANLHEAIENSPSLVIGKKNVMCNNGKQPDDKHAGSKPGKQNYMRSKKFEENCSENEREISTDVLQDASSVIDNDCVKGLEKNTIKKYKLKKTVTNSSPILIEMSGKCSIPSNPFDEQISNVKKQNVKSLFKNKSDLRLRPCLNVTSTQNWEVQYGNAELLNSDYDSVDAHMRNEIQYNLNMLDHEKKESLLFDSTARIDPVYVENEIADHEILDLPEAGRNVTLFQNPEESIYYSDIDSSCVQHKLFAVSGTEMILALPPSCSIFFKGALEVKVLVGKIDVLGCELNSAAAESYTVYSPNGTSCLGFRADVENYSFPSEKEYWKLVKDTLPEKLHIDVLYKIPEFTTLVLLGNVSDPLISFLHKYFPNKHFPTKVVTWRKPANPASAILRVEFLTLDELLVVNTAKSEWISLEKLLFKREPGDMRIMPCGGKHVGKSTFLRYLINRALSKFKEVLYIDLDPGQCEFTPPGCVSATIVKHPLLGPNFTHLTCPEKSVFVGEVDISKCPFHYIQCAKYILDWCCSQPQLSHLPWFINTMGYSEGLGAEMTLSIIKSITLSDVIEICSVCVERNFHYSLEPLDVQNFSSSFDITVNQQEGDLNYSFHRIHSSSENPVTAEQSPFSKNSGHARNTALLSYFSHIVAPPAFSLLEAKSHVLPFSGLKLCVTSEKVKFSDYLSVINANLVALCDARNIDGVKPSDPEYPEILQNTPICQCLGFGIVRCIDLQKKCIFIISPLEPEIFKSVDCLVMGAVYLPSLVYFKQEMAHGNIPYVTYREPIILDIPPRL